MSAQTTSIDYSPTGIFLAADPVVKAVIVALLAASIVSWTIILARALAIRVELRNSAQLASSVGGLSGPAGLKDIAGLVPSSGGHIVSAMADEWSWSLVNRVQGYDQVRARLLSVVDLAIVRETAKIAGATSLLATVGSIAPFVGLFGTVWGIMHSFIAIGQTQDTSLAVVAPGIAEALMATAVGLFCAIPAVIGYNRLIHALGNLDSRWRDTAGAVEVAISRRFDRAGS